MLSRFIFLVCASTLAACAGNGTTPAKPASGGFDATQLAKTDIDRVAEAHQRDIFQNLKLIAEKLYRRNPRELKKSGQASVATAIARIFERQHQWKFAELEGKRGTEAIHIAFRDDYQGDRVLALIAGLASMIQTAFNDKTEFFFARRPRSSGITQRRPQCGNRCVEAIQHPYLSRRIVSAFQ